MGVTEHNSMKRLNIMNKLAYEKAAEALRRGKQV